MNLRQPVLLRAAVLAAWAVSGIAPATAATVIGQYTQLGGHAWQASFTVVAGASQVIEGFLIDFDFDKASHLALLASPAQWDTLVLQPDATLLAAGQLDALALPGTSIRNGAQLSGFSVEFDWLGTTAPGALPFAIYDPSSFVVLETGTTTPMAGAAGVPEPASWLLGALALGLLAAQSAQRPLTNSPQAVRQRCEP
jgi:hypothetical protein